MTSWARPAFAFPSSSSSSSSFDPSSPLSVSPAETALLVIDYQNLSMARLGDAGPSVVKIASQMHDWALQRGMSVFHCLIDTAPGVRPPAWSKLAGKWKMFYQEKLAKEAWLGWEVEGLAPKDDGGETGKDTVMSNISGRAGGGPGSGPRIAPFDAGGVGVAMGNINKPGIFEHAEAQTQAQARDREITVLRQPGLSLILCGITTSGTVLSTARAATDRGFIVTVVEDACFDLVPGLHAMLVTHVLPTTAHVATSGEIRDAWKVL
ncbi:hypothetical protein A1O1_05850 [Capronia coronata CBS 617.96]|uniref:Isochorismatase-like domain-containing protein n=1 Tax=Capronia coronata CBS 617.96 TaxID=1182541 RepID=W9Y8C9_9EURO|nr:uncharacterized protein A1O1_05850 [Capronia coronata CBS 617.96]EXJ85486.1 hypothetical protein A1O1_05850 [Capronia coronata CBS 617.96]